jgi:hypothetical protein
MDSERKATYYAKKRFQNGMVECKECEVTGVLSITKLEELPIKNKSASGFR